MNRFAGYGNLSKEFNICTGVDGEPSDLALSRIGKSTDKVQMNRELIKPQRYDVSPWNVGNVHNCLLYTSPSPRDRQKSRMPSSA